MSIRFFIAAAAAVGLAAVQAQATVVFQDSFTGASISGTTLSSAKNWFVSQATDSTVSISDLVGNPAASVMFSDTSTAGAAGYVTLNFGAFDTPFNMATPGQEVLSVSFDFRVDSYDVPNPGHGSTYRFAVRNTINSVNHFFVFGLGRVSPTGIGDRVVFFAGDGGTSNVLTPTSSNMIGYVDGQWVPGFNLGAWDTNTANNDTNDEFYRVKMTFTKDATSVQVDVTRLSTGESITVWRPSTPFSFSQTVNDNMSMLAPGTGTGVAYFDNVVVESAPIPEPSALALLSLGGLLMIRRRR